MAKKYENLFKNVISVLTIAEFEVIICLAGCKEGGQGRWGQGDSCVYMAYCLVSIEISFSTY